MDELELGRKAGNKLWGTRVFGLMEADENKTNPAIGEWALRAWSLFTRKQLEPKYRSLCLISCLVNIDAPMVMRVHVFAALNNGATREEIEEAIITAMPYTGIPRANSALRTARQCFEQYKRPGDIVEF